MNIILIVEDDSDIAESLQYNFQREGFSSIIAESGEKGLRLALAGATITTATDELSTFTFAVCVKNRAMAAAASKQWSALVTDLFRCRRLSRIFQFKIIHNL